MHSSRGAAIGSTELLGLAQALLCFCRLMKNLSLLFILSIALIVTACQPREEDLTGNDPLEQAYRKIDQGKTSEAISDLEALIKKDPRPKVREALASAYAARAGVKIDSYWGAVVGFEAPLLTRGGAKNEGFSGQAARLLSQLEGRRDLRGRDELTKLTELLLGLAEWKARIDQLPMVPSARRDDLDEALFILQDHHEPGGRLYRALLGLIMLKSEIADGFSGWDRIEDHFETHGPGNLPPAGQQPEALCVVDYAAFSDWSELIMFRLRNIAEDVAVAYPSKAKGLQNAIHESERIALEFQNLGGRTCP